MTEEQKRYKILKRTSYEEQISYENKIATLKTFSLGISSAASLIGLAGLVTHAYIGTKLIDLTVGLLNTGFCAYHINGLMNSISRKTMLQGKIEEINEELETSENEKCKVMR